MQSKALIFFANEVTGVVVAPQAFWGRYTAAANEKADNWVQLSPFGDFPNAKGMQRVRKEDAEAIVNEFNSPLNLEARTMGLPWYVGHPDFPGFEKKYPDTSAKGRIKKLEVRHDSACQRCNNFCNETSEEPCGEHGLFANVKWNENGKRLIQNEEYHGHSVNWGGIFNGGLFRPVALKSVGFTNEPQIPVQPITTANEQHMSAENKPTTLMGWIKLLTGKDVTEATACNEMEDFYNTRYKPMLDGNTVNEAVTTALAPLNLNRGDKPLVLFVANELVSRTATVATLTEGNRKLTADLATANASLATKTGEISQLTTEKSQVVNERDALKTAKEAAETNFTNERKAHAALIGEHYLFKGHITAAEKEAVVNEAIANVTAANTRLAALPAKWRNQSQTTGVGTRNSNVNLDAAARAEQVQTFVNELMAKDSKLTYEKAFAKVQKDKPELFAAMQKPEGVSRNGN